MCKRNFIRQSALSDVVIVCRGREFRVHKAFLADRSPLFLGMLTGDFEEARTGRIVLDRCEPSDVDQLVRFIYRERVTAVSCGLFELAEMYELHRLKSVCCEGLTANLNANNCADTMKLAYLHSQNELLNSANKFYKNNKDLVTGSDG
jgi:hypothetical protein